MFFFGRVNFPSTKPQIHFATRRNCTASSPRLSVDRRDDTCLFVNTTCFTYGPITVGAARNAMFVPDIRPASILGAAKFNNFAGKIAPLPRISINGQTNRTQVTSVLRSPPSVHNCSPYFIKFNQ